MSSPLVSPAVADLYSLEGGFEIDLLRRELRSVSGQPLDLPARAFDVLVHLVANRGRDVSRQELMRAAWPTTVVEDNNLDQAISSLRRVLGDSRSRPRYLLTVPGRGYRFVGAIRVLGNAASSADQPAMPTGTYRMPSPASRASAPPRATERGRATAAWVAAAVLLLLGSGAVAWRMTRAPVDAAPAAAVAPVSAEAYQWYAAGLYHWQRREPGAYEAAARDFEAALRLAPDYAPAWSALAGVLTATAVFGTAPPRQVLPRAAEAARRALELAPGSADSEAAAAHVLVQYARRYDEAEQRYARAVALDPRAPHVRMWRAINLAHLGQLDAALQEMQEAQRLEPRTLAYAVNLGMLKYLSRDYPGAVSHLRRLRAVEPRSDHVKTMLGRALLATGEVEGAMEQFAARSTTAPGGSGDVGRAHALAGRVGEAESEIARLERLATGGFGVRYEIAGIYAALGRPAPACAQLEASLADLSQGIGMLRFDPAMDALRSTECFRSVHERLYGAPP
jgi:DNA-binding winged helix-turn-helix (wHTH) protein/Tfp pilus assembly protein PilF